MTCLTLRPEESGQRIDQYLAETVEGLTRSGAQKLLEGGGVTVNGKQAKKKCPADPRRYGDSLSA